LRHDAIATVRRVLWAVSEQATFRVNPSCRSFRRTREDYRRHLLHDIKHAGSFQSYLGHTLLALEASQLTGSFALVMIALAGGRTPSINRSALEPGSG
jgi:hypothetical protein